MATIDDTVSCRAEGERWGCGMMLMLDPANSLTPREQQTLYLVACGLSNKEIAVSFGVSEQTVKTHVANMMAKSSKANRAALVTYGFETGILRAG